MPVFRTNFQSCFVLVVVVGEEEEGHGRETTNVKDPNISSLAPSSSELFIPSHNRLNVVVERWDQRVIR